LPQPSTVCIATDTRISREVIKGAVISGVLSSGINVVDLGISPTPVLALLTRQLGFAAGIMVTASHNPPDFNGIKLFTGDSLGYSQAQEAEIEEVYFAKKFRQGKKGTLEHANNVKQGYLSFIKNKLPPLRINHRLKIVVDPGNGAASGFASDILAQMGFTTIPVNDEPDGLFPGRNPEPRVDTLQGTIDFVRQQNADLAICFDGDADRVVFCDKEGFLGFNEPIAFISRLVVRETGKKRVATTVETGKLLDLAVNDLGAEVHRGKVGDVNVAYLAQELDAALGVEQVGVYILPQVGYYPDSIFASLILLGHLGEVGEIRRYFQDMPRLFFEKDKVPCPNELKEQVMAQMQEKAHLFAASNINTLDGLRLEFGDSWMLVRASGTEPAIRVIAESISKSRTDELIDKGTKLVQSLVEGSR
jgi:phosphoglucosamine mutase